MFEKKFESYWEKEVNLNIYKKEDDEKKLIINSKLDLFVYKKSIAFVFDSTIWEEKIEDFKNMAIKSWIYVYEIWVLKEKEVENINILEKLNKHTKILCCERR